MPAGMAVVRGSSPLTRGKRFRRCRGRARRRLIPAHAGKTLPACRWARRARAHPRSRGENLVGEQNVPIEHGSSPLTRGKLRFPVLGAARAGLIPAHAGKTCRCCPHSSRRWAHPRSRGENSYTSAIDCLPVGSSPLTRGKRSDPRVPRVRRGLIPAHAGKTSTSWSSPSGDLGSSPLTRGKQHW